MTLNNLGNAYRDLPGGDRAQALDLALRSFDAALEALGYAADQSARAQIERNRLLALREIERLPKP
ncbi:MAG: hypothetical protein BWZ10_00688 [candidate division BRC1 bacterium ADurb.BinA364]|nr:MAG: hypothetical protein BWZ10_00688 [candidate division BRC1 bacterium ADurb.BinA364]